MFKVGISGDLLNSENKPCFGDAPLELLKVRKDIEFFWMDKSITEVSSKMASQFDAILLNLPKASLETVSNKNCKLKIISRFGVGFDSVDIAAMKEKGIVVTNTPNAVRRPVAVAALTMIFAMASKLIIKDKLVRKGNWKLIEGLGSGGFTEPQKIEQVKEGVNGQLYNLKSDPKEANDVFETNQEKVKELRNLLQEIKGYKKR